MSKRGRFGKYGENKRIDRLRQARAWKTDILREKGARKLKTAFRIKSQLKGTQITVKPAGPLDVDYIRTLSEKVFRMYGAYEDLLPYWFESDITVTLVALMEKRPAGFVMLSQPGDRQRFPHVCELLAIGVEPAKQRHGIGHRLMGDIERMAGDLGIGRIILHTDVKNRASRKLFEKNLFIPSEVKKSFYPMGQDALMMYKDIIK